MTKKELKQIQEKLSPEDLDVLVLLMCEGELEEIDAAIVALGKRRGAVQDRIDALKAAMGSGQKKAKKRATRKAAKKTGRKAGKRAKKKPAPKAAKSKPKAGKAKVGITDAMVAILKDEGGPLSREEIAERLPKFGYDASGVDKKRLVQRAGVSLCQKKIFKYMGKGIGYTLVE